MLPFAVLAVTTGTWIMLAILAAFSIVGLFALVQTADPERRRSDAVRYVFGLGKHPRLVLLPEARDLEATPEPPGGKGLAKLAADAGAKTVFTATQYRLPDGRTAPYELSEDIPDDVTEIELTHDDLTVWLDDEGLLTASRLLGEEEREALGDLLISLEGEGDVRADRRTWAAAGDTPGDSNVQRV